MIYITREHSICAGHRVVGQGGHCERLHGHEYVFYMTCTATELNEIGMVLDFSEIKKRLCEWLEMNWDHRFLVWDEDPWREALAMIDPSVVWVPFNPTAEEIARYFSTKIAPGLLKGTGATLVKCTVNETRKCSATYET